MSKVGYCNPPAHTRFQPGQSGNPAGRPRGSKNFSTQIMGILLSNCDPGLLLDETYAKRLLKKKPHYWKHLPDRNRNLGTVVVAETAIKAANGNLRAAGILFRASD